MTNDAVRRAVYRAVSHDVRRAVDAAVWEINHD
jgi:hypothetical protein